MSGAKLQTCFLLISATFAEDVRLVLDKGCLQWIP